MKVSAGDILKAVIPAAGMGTRFLPLTKAQPKEMLPVVDKPVIQYVVEEAISAGIEDILIVTGRDKRAIEDHFDESPELERTLEHKHNNELLKSMREITNMASLHYVRQKSPSGLADAIYCARHHIGDESFAVMLGDTINIADVPLVRQLIDAHKPLGASVIAVERVSQEKISDYGIVGGHMLGERLIEIDRLVEKPSPKNAPSDIGITGTYILTPGIFEAIEQTEPGVNGEIQLTDALRVLAKKEKIYGYLFTGKRYDVGDMLLWMKVNLELSLKSEKYGRQLREFLKTL